MNKGGCSFGIILLAGIRLIYKWLGLFLITAHLASRLIWTFVVHQAMEPLASNMCYLNTLERFFEKYASSCTPGIRTLCVILLVSDAYETIESKLEGLSEIYKSSSNGGGPF